MGRSTSELKLKDKVQLKSFYLGNRMIFWHWLCIRCEMVFLVWALGEVASGRRSRGIHGTTDETFSWIRSRWLFSPVSCEAHIFCIYQRFSYRSTVSVSLHTWNVKGYSCKLSTYCSRWSHLRSYEASFYHNPHRRRTHTRHITASVRRFQLYSTAPCWL